MFQGQQAIDGSNTNNKPDFWRDPRPTNENPNFVHDYFQSSRLHFIGSFRARYEAMMVSVGKKLNVNPGTLLQSSIQRSALASQRKPKERCIVHVDMDCFFASIAIRDNPSLRGKCIAVSHGGGEISSCNYEARKYGVRAGMFCKDARKICPQIISVPYDFPSYEKVSIQIYARFYSLPGVAVEAVSVDEAYLDITLAVGDDRDASSQSSAEAIVQTLRDRIVAETGCTASAGIGPSKLIARLATKAAKPNGQLRVRQENVISYLDTLKAKDLPGIGWRTGRKLAELGIKTCSELRAKSLRFLQNEFGEKQGQTFYDYVRGLDLRRVEPLKPRKSIGAEASWGVRFYESENLKVRKFLNDMADEVATRVMAAGAYGTKVTFKVYHWIRDADMTGYKHLGHGPCNIFTRSTRLPARITGDTFKEALRKACADIYRDLNVKNENFRGLGVQVGDLTFADLNFDYTALPSSGTRRIDSFFKTNAKQVPQSVSEAAHATTSTAGARDGNEVIDEHIILPDFPIAEVPTSESDSDEIKAVSIVEQEKRHSDDSIENETHEPIDILVRSPQKDIDVESNIVEESDNDIQNAAPDIPAGLDHEVFKALPLDIQKELLKESTSRPQNRRPTGPAFQQPMRKRSREDKNELDKRMKKKQAAQVTMTQFADISKLRKRGTDVLHAAEFRERPLRECVELLHDLRPKQLAGRSSPRRENERNVVDDENNTRNNEYGDMDIPSPPSLSSDSDSSYGVNGMIERFGIDHSQIYETEDVTEFAPMLQQWMVKMSAHIKSGHMELLRSRLVEMVRLNRLQATNSELMTIKTFAEEIENRQWRSRFNEILREVQDEVERLYGFRLAIAGFNHDSEM